MSETLTKEEQVWLSAYSAALGYGLHPEAADELGFEAIKRFRQRFKSENVTNSTPPRKSRRRPLV